MENEEKDSDWGDSSRAREVKETITTQTQPFVSFVHFAEHMAIVIAKLDWSQLPPQGLAPLISTTLPDLTQAYIEVLKELDEDKKKRFPQDFMFTWMWKTMKVMFKFVIHDQ